jgi:hypothetical protein
MSRSGPINMEISYTYRRVMFSSSRGDILLGSHWMPPLAPPKGMLTTAHFQVIHMARAFISSRSTSGWYRIPPLAGPRVVLCWMRYPVKILMVPSSILTGKLTVSSRLVLLILATTPGSRFRWATAFSTCFRATSNELILFSWSIIAYLQFISYIKARQEF